MAPALRRSIACSSLVSHQGAHPGDRSSLLVCERPGRQSSGECLALHGAFDQAHEPLTLTLRRLSLSRLPLTLDLQGICSLDEGFLLRLLKLQRELAPYRAVSFQIAAAGPVLPLIQRFGLESRFGLEPVKRPPLKRTAALPTFPAARADAEKRDFIAS